jgi:hypothetical protein
VTAIVVTTLVANYFLMAWTEPTLPPPGGGPVIADPVLTRTIRASAQQNLGTGAYTGSWTSPICESDEILIDCGLRFQGDTALYLWGDGPYEVNTEFHYYVAREQIGFNRCHCAIGRSQMWADGTWAECNAMCLKIQ